MIALILVHRGGVVLAATTVVSSHVRPLTSAILILLMRLTRVCVHAAVYLEWTYMLSQTLSTTVLANRRRM